MKSCHLQEMDGTGGHYGKRNKPDTERQVLHVFSHVWKQRNKQTLTVKEGL